MNVRLIFTVIVILSSVLSGRGWAVGSPIGPPTVPPSGISPGLVRSTSPIDTSVSSSPILQPSTKWEPSQTQYRTFGVPGNLIITGNVSGGKHFRGAVPYRSSLDFRAPLGSSSFDSFLRSSAGSGNIGRYGGGYEPYYSSSATVTGTRPDGGGVFKPPTTIGGFRRAGTDEFALPSLPKKQTQPGSEISVSKRRLQPTSMTPLELEKATSGLPNAKKSVWGPSAEVGTYPRGGTTAGGEADEQFQAQMEQFRQNLKQVREKAAELERSVTGQAGVGLELAGSQTGERSAFELPAIDGKTEILPSTTKGVRRSDVYERVKQQVYSVGTSTGSVTERDFESAIGGAAAEPAEEDLISRGLLSALGQIDERGAEEIARDYSQAYSQAVQESYQAQIDELEDYPPEIYQAQDYRVESYQPDELSKVTLSAARARGILGSHKTITSFSRDKFGQHIRAAEERLKQGRYYWAAESYALALIYKPDDPLAYIGRSHALFAAGEYISSALYLSRALEILPELGFYGKLQKEVPAEYAGFKIDFESMIADSEQIESRIADIKEWQERSDSAELQFLLGYIYYQLGRPGEAKEQIERVYKKLPEAPAVIAVKKAIDDAVGSGPGKNQGQKH